MAFLRPTYIVEHVTDINLEDLKADGIKGFMFDLDNTLMAPHSGQLTVEIALWLEKVKENFKIAILSNNPHQKYIEQAAKEIGCIAYAKAKKPKIKTALQALKDLDLLPSQIAMVGDRPLTDIWVGQRLKLTTVLVDPLIKHKEVKIVKMLRRLERIFIKSPSKIFTQVKK